MTPNPYQNICLFNEVDTSIRLIKKGFAELQQINGSNDFYHPPILLISSGFERLMKCILCLRHLHIEKKYPPSRHLIKCGGKKGHDLSELLQHIIDICEETDYGAKRPAIRDDMNFLIKNLRLHNIIQILSDFAQGGRYYYLDTVTNGNSGFDEPGDKWQELETEICLENKEIKKLMKDPKKADEMYIEINKILIIYLERFARALCRIFTLGALDKIAGQCYSYISDFLNLMDENLGKTDY